MKHKGYPYQLIHRGQSGCGKPAFYLSEIPTDHTKVMPDIALNLDGTKPELQTKIVCGSCGKVVMQESLEVDYVEARP